jgi:hypothetical protein
MFLVLKYIEQGGNTWLHKKVWVAGITTIKGIKQNIMKG